MPSLSRPARGQNSKGPQGRAAFPGPGQKEGAESVGGSSPLEGGLHSRSSSLPIADASGLHACLLGPCGILIETAPVALGPPSAPPDCLRGWAASTAGSRCAWAQGSQQEGGSLAGPWGTPHGLIPTPLSPFPVLSAF